MSVACAAHTLPRASTRGAAMLSVRPHFFMVTARRAPFLSATIAHLVSDALAVTIFSDEGAAHMGRRTILCRDTFDVPTAASGEAANSTAFLCWRASFLRSFIKVLPL